MPRGNSTRTWLVAVPTIFAGLNAATGGPAHTPDSVFSGQNTVVTGTGATGASGPVE